MRQKQKQIQTKNNLFLKKSNSIKKKKYKGQLDDKLSKLPHIEVIMTLPESELVCPVCNSKLVPVGKKFVRHEIEFVPAKLKSKRCIYNDI